MFVDSKPDGLESSLTRQDFLKKTAAGLVGSILFAQPAYAEKLISSDQSQSGLRALEGQLDACFKILPHWVELVSGQNHARVECWTSQDKLFQFEVAVLSVDNPHHHRELAGIVVKWDHFYPKLNGVIVRGSVIFDKEKITPSSQVYRGLIYKGGKEIAYLDPSNPNATASAKVDNATLQEVAAELRTAHYDPQVTANLVSSLKAHGWKI